MLNKRVVESMIDTLTVSEDFGTGNSEVEAAIAVGGVKIIMGWRLNSNRMALYVYLGY